MRHTIYRRAIAILVVLLVFAQMGQVAFSYHQKQKEAAEAGQDMEQKALTLWYTDEKLNSYLVQTAADYKKQTGERMVKVYYHLEDVGRERLEALVSEYREFSQVMNEILNLK